MDPDETLRRLRELLPIELPEGSPITLQEVGELFNSLDDWLTDGGFLPADWAGPGGGDREGRHR